RAVTIGLKTYLHSKLPFYLTLFHSSSTRYNIQFLRSTVFHYDKRLLKEHYEALHSDRFPISIPRFEDGGLRLTTLKLLIEALHYDLCPDLRCEVRRLTYRLLHSDTFCISVPD